MKYYLFLLLVPIPISGPSKCEVTTVRCERYQPDNPAAAVLRVSREDLSGLAGASKETVIRTLSDFKGEKLIDITGKEIHILKFDKLKNMPN